MTNRKRESVAALYVPADDAPVREVDVETPEERRSWEEGLGVSVVERGTLASRRALWYGDDVARLRGLRVNERASAACGIELAGDVMIVGWTGCRHRDTPDELRAELLEREEAEVKER